MDNALQLFGSFILTLLGFILPIITILLSLLPDGVKALATKYENEKKQSEDNIIEELKKKEKEKEAVPVTVPSEPLPVPVVETSIPTNEPMVESGTTTISEEIPLIETPPVP